MFQPFPPQMMPPDVQFTPDGEPYRVVQRHSGRQVLRDGKLFYEIERVRRPVAFTRADALLHDADFYDREHGWLRGGRKREKEAPENLGSEAFRGEVVYEEVPPAEQPKPKPGVTAEMPADAVIVENPTTEGIKIALDSYVPSTSTAAATASVAVAERPKGHKDGCTCPICSRGSGEPAPAPAEESNNG